MQILANQAPIGFEAEFVNQRDITILYRGILLPFSSDNETIDFIYGVINWKEMADAAKADELLLEIDQALETEEVTDMKEDEEPLTLTELAPANDSADEEPVEDIVALTPPDEDVETTDEANNSFAQLTPWSDDDVPSIHGDDDMDEDNYGLPEPAFGDYHLGDEEEEDEEDEAEEDEAFSLELAAASRLPCFLPATPTPIPPPPPPPPRRAAPPPLPCSPWASSPGCTCTRPAPNGRWAGSGAPASRPPGSPWRVPVP